MDYPKREKYFAHQFVRLLTKSAAAQDLGPEVCWLLTVIAHQEDSKRYKGAVTYYNEQLMPLAGFGGRSRLVRARDKAVSAGWLHYEQGGKGAPGKYWVTVPDKCEGLPDDPCDESDSILNQDGNAICRPELGHQPGRQPDGNRDGKPAPSYPIPIPNPNARSRTKQRAAVHSDGQANGKFEEWYLLYPRHKDRKRAADAYRHAVIKVDHRELCEATRRFAESDVGKGPKKYIPYPATWLNGERWLDDPEEDSDQPVKRCATKKELAEWTP